jgi:hypothetical protein
MFTPLWGSKTLVKGWLYRCLSVFGVGSTPIRGRQVGLQLMSIRELVRFVFHSIQLYLPHNLTTLAQRIQNDEVVQEKGLNLATSLYAMYEVLTLAALLGECRKCHVSSYMATI